MPNGRHAARPQSEGPLLTQQFTITVSRPDGTSIPVVVTKKRVKNFNLRVTSSGEVHASAPLDASRERIEAFVKRNSAWIISRLAQREQRQATAREPLSPSSIIALWGKPITVQDALDRNFASPAPRPKQATFASFMGADKSNERPQAKRRATLDGLTSDELQTRIDQLYASEVTTALRDMARAYEIAMGVAVSRVSVRSMKTRWGSCTPKSVPFASHANLPPIPSSVSTWLSPTSSSTCSSQATISGFTPCSTRTVPTIELCRSGSSSRPSTSSSVD